MASSMAEDGCAENAKLQKAQVAIAHQAQSVQSPTETSSAAKDRLLDPNQKKDRIPFPGSESELKDIARLCFDTSDQLEAALKSGAAPNDCKELKNFTDGVVINIALCNSLLASNVFMPTEVRDSLYHVLLARRQFLSALQTATRNACTEIEQSGVKAF